MIERGWATETSLDLFFSDKDQIIVICRCWFIREISINPDIAKSSRRIMAYLRTLG
jgi:hypothetical protein